MGRFPTLSTFLTYKICIENSEEKNCELRWHILIRISHEQKIIINVFSPLNSLCLRFGMGESKHKTGINQSVQEQLGHDSHLTA